MNVDRLDVSGSLHWIQTFSTLCEKLYQFRSSKNSTYLSYVLHVKDSVVVEYHV